MKTIRAAILSACLFLAAGAAAGQAPVAQKVNVDIPAQRLGDALNELAHQANVQVVFYTSIGAGLTVKPLSGSFTAEEAVRRLLAETSLRYRFLDPHTIAIQSAEDVGSGPATGDLRPDPAVGGIRLAVAGSVNGPAGESADLASNSPTEDSSANRLEEITVTATKREVSIQKVPMSVTGFSEEALQRMGADNFSDFALKVPGLHMSDTGSNGAQFVIRGIAPLGGDTQDTVVPYIDDLPTTDSSANITTPDLRLFDVERVEILRGPQGTLFGSGAMGGAIRILTNKPVLSGYAAKVELGLEQTEGGALSSAYNAMVNLPLLEDRMALRVVGYYRNEGGWLDTQGDPNVRGSIQGTEKNANSETAYGGRVMWRFKPVEQLDVLARLSYQKSEPDGRPYYTSIDGGQRVQRRAINDFYFEEAKIANLVVNYDFGPAVLKSSTTYYDHDGGRVEDFSVFSGFIFPDLRASKFVQQAPSKSVFEEVHLTSNGEGPLNWLVGLYYRDQYRRTISNRFYVPGSEDLLGSGINGAPDDVAWSLDANFKTKEKALFGEVSYRLAERLVGTVGLRRFDNSIETRSGQSGGLFYPDGPSFVNLDSNDKNTNYKFSLAYTPLDKVMVYFTAAEGYRVGNANLVPLGSAGGSVPPSYGPDSLWNYELGTKSTLLNDRLVINAAAYYIDWSDMQVGASSPEGFGYIANIGKAHSQGVELEVTALLGQTFEYTGSAAYVDARIDVDNENLGASSGDRIPNMPKVMFSNTLRKTFKLAGKNSYFQVSHQYAGKSYNNFATTCQGACLPEGDFHLVGIRAGTQLGRWDVSGFVNNVFNDDSIANIYDIAGGTRYYPVVPRTFGVSFRADF